ncbi:Por secretion system C-terminal sorting domain-containing protein [Dyadobacter sp. SG02]|uniref:T9SS type A sorting domain-containing protein n=1 Tax=Dyadobacter sp. SG02 TaxID=1855291 RepID=UPI0008AD072A|nr:T9SS type A sorting domain-containing protein [Dyadobacter sp. SG02]SEI52116.1 Por secretion system C-terminal sorting domain-containing protein [Dyadobacter sp. SG02]
MKTFTLAICLLFSALVSYATVLKSGYPGKVIKASTAVGHHNSGDDAGAFKLCLEAEDADGTGPVSEDPNASNSKTRGERDNWDYYVDYTPNDVPAGKYQLTIRYYAESDATVNVAVNDGSTFAVNLPASHSWNIAWAEHTIELTLNEGHNKIRIQEQYGYNVRQDKICLTKVGEPVTCNYSIGTIVSNNHPSCGQGVGVSADCFGAGCLGLNYKWSGPGVDISGTNANYINFYAPSTNGTHTYTMTTSKPGCAESVREFSITVSGCTNVPFTACVEAENSNGNGPVTGDPNASNGKTRGAEDNWDHYVEYAVNGVQTAGFYELTLRYYAAGDGAVDIIVNETDLVPVVGLPATHSWNIVWGERTVTVHLAAGDNKIRVAGLPGYSPVRQDKICVVPSDYPGTSPSCDFNVEAKAVRISESCQDAVAIYPLCSGPDCESVTYRWRGHGIDVEGEIVRLPPPGMNGTFVYTVTATKSLCVPKTATVEFTTTGCDAGEPFSACVEAEHSASNGPGSDDPNASNGQTRGAENNYDYYVDYAINDVPVSGTYPVTLRYYAAQNARVNVNVNDVFSVPSLSLPATNSWNIVWREETFQITLLKGNNVVRIQGLPGAACRQDRLCVHPAVSNMRMAAPEGIEAQNQDPALQIFPNPAPGEFKATFYLKIGEPGTIRVTDVQGKIWHTQHIKGKGSHEERINLGNAPSGIYLLQVKKNDSVETKKILVVR